MKLGSNGLIQWQKTYGGSGEDRAESIALTADGGYVVAGYSNSQDGDVTGNNGSFDYWVLKIDDMGDVEWQNSLGGSGVDRAFSVSQTVDGGFIVAGHVSSSDGDVTNFMGATDIWMVKLDQKRKPFKAMRKYIRNLLIILLFFWFSELSYSQELSVKKYDASISLGDARFNDKYLKGIVPCADELYLYVVVNTGKDPNVAVRIKGEHFVNGKSAGKLKLLNNAWITQRASIYLSPTSKINPFYPKNHPNLLLRSTDEAPVIKPESLGEDKSYPIGGLDGAGLPLKSITIKVPFEPSSDNGELKLNKYVIEIDRDLYVVGDNGVLKIKDSKDLYNKDEAIYSKRCIDEKNFKSNNPDEGDPPILAETRFEKIVKSYSPNPVSHGQFITIVINDEIESPKQVKVMATRLGFFPSNAIPLKLIQGSFSSHEFLIDTEAHPLSIDGIYTLFFTYPGWENQAFTIVVGSKKW